MEKREDLLAVGVDRDEAEGGGTGDGDFGFHLLQQERVSALILFSFLLVLWLGIYFIYKIVY